MAVLGPPSWVLATPPVTLVDIKVEIDLTSLVAPAPIQPWTLGVTKLGAAPLGVDARSRGWVLGAAGPRGQLGEFAINKAGADGGVSEDLWEDVTEWVRRISCERGGARRVTESHQAGTASIELDDADRRFDPTNSIGPYVFGGVTQLRGRRSIRVRAFWGGSWWPIWAGFVTRWPPQYFEPGFSTVTLECKGLFSVLASVNPPALSAPFGSGLGYDEHVRKLAEIAQLASSRLQLEDGLTPLQSHDFAQNALSTAHRVASSEGGLLFETAAGRIAGHNRNHRTTASRSVNIYAVATDDPQSLVPVQPWTLGVTKLGEAPLGIDARKLGDVLVHDAQPVTDTEEMVNYVTAGKVGGTAAPFQDAPSVARDGIRDTTRTDLLIRDDADVEVWANLLLAQAANTVTRFPAFKMQPTFDSPAAWLALSAEIGDRIRCDRHPLKGIAPGSPISTQGWVEGIHHQIDMTTGEWLTTIQLLNAP
jgi:hypothetical protein